jgi:hypothetical protein
MSPRPTPIPETDPETEARVSVLEHRQDDVEHRLFGNGQPGILQRMEEKIDRVDKKVTILITIVGLLSGGAGAGIGKLVELLAK